MDSKYFRASLHCFCLPFVRQFFHSSMDLHLMVMIFKDKRYIGSMPFKVQDRKPRHTGKTIMASDKTLLSWRLLEIFPNEV